VAPDVKKYIFLYWHPGCWHFLSSIFYFYPWHWHRQVAELLYLFLIDYKKVMNPSETSAYWIGCGVN